MIGGAWMFKHTRGQRAVVKMPTPGEQAAHIMAAQIAAHDCILHLSRVELDGELARVLRALNKIEDILWQEKTDLERRIKE